MSNRENIFTDLREIEENIIELENIANKTTISNNKLANTLENLRRILEHTASDIADKYSYKGNIYFPYGKRLHEYKNHLQKKSGLHKLADDNPAALDLIREIQPFNSSTAWLSELFSITNNTKHRSHEKQRHINRSYFNIADGAFTVGTNAEGVSIENCALNGVPLPNMYFNSGKVKLNKSNHFGPNLIIKIEENKVILPERKIDVILFLKECHEQISIFVDKIFNVI